MEATPPREVDFGQISGNFFERLIGRGGRGPGAEEASSSGREKGRKGGGVAKKRTRPKMRGGVLDGGGAK